jgi:hypothetical protein
MNTTDGDASCIHTVLTRDTHSVGIGECHGYVPGLVAGRGRCGESWWGRMKGAEGSGEEAMGVVGGAFPEIR